MSLLGTLGTLVLLAAAGLAAYFLIQWFISIGWEWTTLIFWFLLLLAAAGFILHIDKHSN